MNYIIYDLEATCWQGSPPGMVQEVIEIGAVRINDYGEVTGTYERFVRPAIHPLLSSFCTDLTSIKQYQVDRAQKFPEVIQEFQDWIGFFDEEEYILCSWGSFDRKMLIENCELFQLESDWVHHINLKRQYQQMQGLQRPFGLIRALEREGLEFIGVHHRGIDDAKNLSQLFLRFFDEWEVYQ